MQLKASRPSVWKAPRERNTQPSQTKLRLLILPLHKEHPLDFLGGSVVCLGWRWEDCGFFWLCGFCVCLFVLFVCKVQLPLQEQCM